MRKSRKRVSRTKLRRSRQAQKRASRRASRRVSRRASRRVVSRRVSRRRQKSHRKNIKKYHYRMDSNICPICYDNLETWTHDYTKNRTKTICGHEFHKNCLDEWRRRGKETCPSCRAYLSTGLPGREISLAQRLAEHPRMENILDVLSNLGLLDDHSAP